MFTLIAEAYKQKYNGVVATRTFPTLKQAEDLMREWGRFGVENQCDEADRIYVCDADGTVISLWSKRYKKPI